MADHVTYSTLQGNGYKQLMLMNADKHKITYTEHTDEISMPVGIFLQTLNATRAFAYGQLFDKPSPLITAKMPWPSDVNLPPYMQGYEYAYRAYSVLATSDDAFRRKHNIPVNVTWGDLHKLRAVMEEILVSAESIPVRGMTLPYTALMTHFNEVVRWHLRTNSDDALRVFAEHIHTIRSIGDPLNPKENRTFKETGAYIEFKR